MVAFASSRQGGGAQVTVYIAAEPRFSSEASQVASCFQRSKIASQEKSPASASHYFLFITDTFLKSKEYLLPLISRLSDPEFKQRLFPIIMDKTVSIFGAGDEQKYVKYWEELPTDSEVEMIRQNIAALIRVLRDTLMPPLDQLLKDDLALVTNAIEKRNHLLNAGHFFFLPPLNGQVVRKAALAKLSSLFEGQNIVSITGAEGTGKTTLAIDYAKQSTYSSGIFWLDATDEQTLEEGYKQLAAQLGINPDQVKRKLSLKKDFLLIYDNVTNRSLVPSFFSSHTLIVGSNLPHSDLILGAFTPEEAEQIESSSKELASTLENHPAKLADAIAYIKRTKISVETYIDFYKNDKERLLQKQQGKISAITSSPTLLSNLDPSPATLQKYLQLPLSEIQKEFIAQNIQIFISYQWGAKKEVDQIDTLFKDLGVELLRDIRETRNFESLREFMKKVIKQSDYTFSIISPNYLKSFNCLFEVITTMQDPYWKHRLFPLVVQGTDLSNTHLYTTHWLQEAERLKAIGANPTEVAIAQEGARKIAPFLEFVKQLQPDALDAQLEAHFQKTLAIMLARQEKIEKKGIYKQAIFHLPMGRNKDFVGREKELTHLEESLKKGTSSAITNTGMGGVGKSQLALEYAYRHETEYEMIYWIRSEQEATIKTDLRALGLEMGIAEDFLKDDNVISTMKNALEKRKGWLLVFDNAEDPQLLQNILPQGGHILITSRNPNWEKAVAVDVFSKEEALSYLQKISGLSGQDEELNLLAEELGYLPLALTQAGAYIRRQQIDVSTYRTAFKEGQKQLLSQKEKGYPGSVATAWLLSMEKITQEDPNAFKLLNICSYLAPDKIPEEFLEAWLKEKVHTTGLDFQDALRILESYSLIEQKVDQKEGSHKKWISIHRLIQTVTQDECAPAADQTIELGVSIMNKQFKGAARTEEERNAGEALVLHAKALIRHAGKRELLSEQMGDIAASTGGFLLDTDNLKEAKEYHEKALQTRIACSGAESMPAADSYNSLGAVAQTQGYLKDAKKLFQKTIDIYLLHLGTNKDAAIGLALTSINMGVVLKAQGDFKGAKESVEKAIECFSLLGAENNEAVAVCFTNLGSVLLVLGETEAAKEYFKKALNMKIACLGTENHTGVALIYVNIGSVSYDQGHFKEAKKHFETALEIFRTCLGTENHTSIATCLNNIGNVLKEQGSLEEAKEFYEKALKIRVDCLGEDHVDVAKSFAGIGFVLKNQGKLEEAKIFLEKAASILISCHGTENQLDVAKTYNGLGGVLRAQGEFVEAKKYCEKDLNITIDCLKTKNHRDVAISYMALGYVLEDQKAFAESEAAYKNALEIRIICLGKNHVLVADTYNTIGLVLKAQGNFDEAKTAYENALEIRKACLGKSHIEVAKNYGYIGSVLDAQEDYNGAKTAHENALEIYIACLGKNHTDVALRHTMLGDVLRSQKDFIGAKEAYENGVKIYIDCLGENDEFVGDCYNIIGGILKAQENYPEAIEHYEKALKIRIDCLGKNHAGVAAIYYNIGHVFKEQEDYAGAKKSYENALEVYVACQGESHKDVANCYNRIGYMLHNLNDFQGARAAYEKSLKIDIECLGENNASVAATYSKMGDVLQDQKDFPGAIAAYKNALDIYIVCPGEHRIDVANRHEKIGDVLLAQKDFSGAKTAYENALKINIACLGENHKDVASLYYNIGIALEGQENFIEAKESYENALKMNIACLGKNHEDVADSYNRLGFVLKAQGMLEEAKTAYENLLAIRIATLGENDTTVAATYFSLGDILQAQGNLEEAKTSYEKALKIRIACLGISDANVAHSYTTLGNVCLSLKKLELAREHYTQAKHIYQQSDGDKYDAYFDGQIKACQE